MLDSGSARDCLPLINQHQHGLVLTSRCMTALMKQLGAKEVKQIVDVGCATGLSSRALMSTFPAAHVMGVDLSPYFVAVGRYQQRQREVGMFATRIVERLPALLLIKFVTFDIHH